MNEDPIMEYGDRFRRKVTITEAYENYELWKTMLRDEAKRIKDSTEGRTAILKGLSSSKPDAWKLLLIACRCIYDMTGDTYFERYTREVIEGIKENGKIQESR